MIFFDILANLNQQNNKAQKYFYNIPRINKSSVDTQEDKHGLIYEQEEDDEDEEQDNVKQDPKSNKKCISKREEDDIGEGEDYDSECKSKEEEEKSLKLETISERTQSVGQVDTRKYINDLIPHVRLALIDRKNLITKIRNSKYFIDDSIFEALIFQEFPERFHSCKHMKKYRRRGFRIEFDLVHENIEVKLNHAEKRTSTFLKRIQKSEFNGSRYVTATHSESLPLHGLHYFEIKILPSENQNVANKIFVGLCNPNENQNLEDTYKDKNSLLFYTYDLNFWTNGAHLPATLGNRYIRLRNSLEGGDIIRIAVDFNYAKCFKSFWKEIEDNHEQTSEQRNIISGQHNYASYNRNPYNHSSEERGVRFRSRDNLNLFLSGNNEPIFFNSPCKIFYALNNSEFSEGVDINLMSLKTAPIHFAVSLLEVGQQVECSRCVYFDSFDHVPHEPILLEKSDKLKMNSPRSQIVPNSAPVNININDNMTSTQSNINT